MTTETQADTPPPTSPQPAVSVKRPWAYLDGLTPANDAPVSDNPSGLYCPACRANGLSHCAAPDYCGEMRPMKAKPILRPHTISFSDEELVTLLHGLRHGMIHDFGQSWVTSVWNPDWPMMGVMFETSATQSVALHRRIEAERKKIKEGSRVRYLGIRPQLNRFDIYTIKSIKAWGGVDRLYATVEGGLPHDEYPLSEFVLIDAG